MRGHRWLTAQLPLTGLERVLEPELALELGQVGKGRQGWEEGEGRP